MPAAAARPARIADSDRHAAFQRGIREIAQAICRRDAEARAHFKAQPAATAQPCARRRYLAGLHRRFERWCYDVLEIGVRTADLQLAAARYRLKQIHGAPRPLDPDAPADAVIATTTLSLVRENSAHELTIALHADGCVRASDDGQRGGRNTLYVEAQVHTLNGTTADRFVSDFVRSAANLS